MLVHPQEKEEYRMILHRNITEIKFGQSLLHELSIGSLLSHYSLKRAHINTVKGLEQGGKLSGDGSGILIQVCL